MLQQKKKKKREREFGLDAKLNNNLNLLVCDFQTTSPKDRPLLKSYNVGPKNIAIFLFVLLTKNLKTTIIITIFLVLVLAQQHYSPLVVRKCDLA